MVSARPKLPLSPVELGFGLECMSDELTLERRRPMLLRKCGRLEGDKLRQFRPAPFPDGLPPGVACPSSPGVEGEGHRVGVMWPSSDVGPAPACPALAGER